MGRVLSGQSEIAFQQWQKAHDLFAEFDRRVPRYAPAQYALGWLDRKLNRPEEARRHIEQSLALDPNLNDARCELAELQVASGEPAIAEENLKRVLVAQPGHVNASLSLGDIRMHENKFDEARQLYEQAIRSDPKSGPGHYKLSIVLVRQHQQERAATERAAGIELNAEALRASKTVLRLAEPDGRLLSEGSGDGKTIP